MKRLVDDLVVTCDETVDISKSVVLIAIACLLLLEAITVKYYMKRGLTIPCLLSNY